MSNHSSNRESGGGGVGGAIAGGFAGASFRPGGALAGAFLGYIIGENMTEEDATDSPTELDIDREGVFAVVSPAFGFGYLKTAL